ncbi:hypothetical protein [Streptomyces marinisediminis]|uniref:hypothetical protein n=1 Tax=Streptomyces TaxID=1883 RepID=UPI003A4C7D57
MLIRHLPRDSAVNLAEHGEAAEWGVSEHLLAATVDHLAAANWMTATLHRDEDEEPLEYPEPVPRPGRADGGAAAPEAAGSADPAAGARAGGDAPGRTAARGDGDADLADPRQRSAAAGPSPGALARFFG